MKFLTNRICQKHLGPPPEYGYVNGVPKGHEEYLIWSKTRCRKSFTIFTKKFIGDEKTMIVDGWCDDHPPPPEFERATREEWDIQLSHSEPEYQRLVQQGLMIE